MADVTIDPKTGSPIVITKAVSVIPTDKVAVTKDNGDSSSKRLRIAEALRCSGGDTMQQNKTYKSILEILGWV